MIVGRFRVGAGFRVARGAGASGPAVFNVVASSGNQDFALDYAREIDLGAFPEPSPRA